LGLKLPVKKYFARPLTKLANKAFTITGCVIEQHCCNDDRQINRKTGILTVRDILFYLFNEFISQHKHKYNNMREYWPNGQHLRDVANTVHIFGLKIIVLFHQ